MSDGSIFDAEFPAAHTQAGEFFKGLQSHLMEQVKPDGTVMFTSLDSISTIGKLSAIIADLEFRVQQLEHRDS